LKRPSLGVHNARQSSKTTKAAAPSELPDEIDLHQSQKKLTMRKKKKRKGELLNGRPQHLKKLLVSDNLSWKRDIRAQSTPHPNAAPLPSILEIAHCAIQASGKKKKISFNLGVHL